jgi:hypothetical protein
MRSLVVPVMSATTHTADIMVCTDCYFAHHCGATMVDREATDDEASDWHAGYLRTGHSLPNVIDETDAGIIIREWFAGESDTPCHREPLGLWVQGHELTDNTDSETGEGIEEFSWRQCNGCGSTLGGSRYRLAVWS